MKRVIVATIFLIIALASVISGGILFAVFLGILIFLGLHELVNIVKAKGMNPPVYFIILASVLFIGLASFRLYDFLFPSFVITAIITFFIILFRGKKAGINDISITLMAIIYSTIFPIHFILIRNLDESSFFIIGKSFSIGMGLLILVFLVIASCDIAAYYTGKTFGKTPLWKAISPKKTVEGSVGGTIAGILMSVLIGNFIGLSISHSLITGFILSLTAQLGDLVESMIKRDVGIKDSGTILPGHGGMLDRADSYIFTAAAGYYYFKFFVVHDISSIALSVFNIF